MFGLVFLVGQCGEPRFCGAEGLTRLPACTLGAVGSGFCGLGTRLGRSNRLRDPRELGRFGPVLTSFAELGFESLLCRFRRGELLAERGKLEVVPAALLATRELNLQLRLLRLKPLDLGRLLRLNARDGQVARQLGDLHTCPSQLLVAVPGLAGRRERFLLSQDLGSQRVFLAFESAHPGDGRLLVGLSLTLLSR